MRFAVLDLDVTGTDVRRDRVRGIAVLPVEAAGVRIADLRYCSVPEAEGKDGPPRWREEFDALKVSIGEAPIVPYNPDFVRRMLARTCRDSGLAPLDGHWLDIVILAALLGREESALTDIDHWLGRMRTGGRWPHDASFDVFAMAQFLAAAVSCMEEAGIPDMASLIRSQKTRAWMRRP
jgi:hypothetical protein